MRDTVEIRQPRYDQTSKKVVAWAPRELIEPYTSNGNWPDTRQVLEHGLNDVRFSIDAISGLTVWAPTGGFPEATALTLRDSFVQLGLPARIEPL